MFGSIFVKPGDGLYIDGDQLTTKWIANPALEKSEDGLYIDAAKIAQNIATKVDQHTIVLTSLDNNKQGLLSINHAIVTCCYSMCAHKLKRKSETDLRLATKYLADASRMASAWEYEPDMNTVKDINDIRNALNLVKDTFDKIGQGIPQGMPLTQYQPLAGDFLTLRGSYRPYIYTLQFNTMTPSEFKVWHDRDKIDVWPTYTDDLQRYETDTIYALFYIECAEWINGYLEQLTIRCIWSSYDSFQAGVLYGSPNLPEEQDIDIVEPTNPNESFAMYVIKLKKGTKTYQIENGTVSDLGEIPSDGAYTVIDETTIDDTRYYRLKDDQLGWITMTASQLVDETSADLNTVIHAGDLISIVEGACYTNGVPVPSWILSKKWWVEEVRTTPEDCVLIRYDEARSGIDICSTIALKYIKIVTPSNP